MKIDGYRFTAPDISSLDKYQQQLKEYGKQIVISIPNETFKLSPEESDKLKEELTKSCQNVGMSLRSIHEKIKRDVYV